MNLLEYTKKLSRKIKFYDEMVNNFNFGVKNPFAKPIDITIIWVDEKD